MACTNSFTLTTCCNRLVFSRSKNSTSNSCFVVVHLLWHFVRMARTILVWRASRSSKKNQWMIWWAIVNTKEKLVADVMLGGSSSAGRNATYANRMRVDVRSESNKDSMTVCNVIWLIGWADTIIKKNTYQKKNFMFVVATEEIVGERSKFGARSSRTKYIKKIL